LIRLAATPRALAEAVKGTRSAVANEVGVLLISDLYR
jgi:hypothetical protein